MRGNGRWCAGPDCYLSQRAEGKLSKPGACGGPKESKAWTPIIALRHKEWVHGQDGLQRSLHARGFVHMKCLRIHTFYCILILAGLLPPGLLAQAGDTGRDAHAPVFVEVHLNSPVMFSHLKPGDVLQGKTTGNVFSGYRLVIPTGSHVSLRVSRMERQKKESSIQWPWPIRHFISKYRNFPTFSLITVSLPGVGSINFPVSLATTYNEIQVAAQGRGAKKSGKDSPASGARLRDKGKQAPGSILELVLETGTSQPETKTPGAALSSRSGGGSLPGIETLSAGTETKLALLGRLSASKSRAGDPFKAVLAEPLRLSTGRVIPQGSLFEGKVRKSIAPRWLSRPGSLYLTFNRLLLPTGDNLSIAASVVGIQTNRQSRMKVGPEGKLRGGSPGKKQLLADLGVGFAISKVADDSFQLIAEALISTATDASTAGTARLVGMALGGLFFIKRRGRDVVLPPYTMIYIRFDRSPTFLSPNPETQGVR